MNHQHGLDVAAMSTEVLAFVCRAAELRFTSLSDICGMVSKSTDYQPLDQRCPLFARKFPFPTAARLQALYSNCSSHLGILHSQREEEILEGRCDPKNLEAQRRKQSKLQLRKLSSLWRAKRSMARSLRTLV